jgi:hypothetical protein
MNDEFLSGFRQSPAPQFTRALYTRLVNEEKARQTVRRTTGKRVALAFAALSLAFALLMIVSPTARTAAQEVIEGVIAKITVKNMTFYVSNDSPDLSRFPQEGESYNSIWTPLSLSDISTDYAFLAKLPAWVPSGYVLQDRVALYYVTYPAKPIPPDAAVYQWKNHAGDTIQLMESEGTSGQLGAGVELTGEPQVIAVNDQPGVIYGGITALDNLADPVKEWNPVRWKIVPKGLTMIWEDEKTTFWLVTNSQKLSRRNLIRMAESIP